MNDIMVEAIKKHCRKYKYTEAYTNYWLAHPFCEICGYYSDPPHHIRTRGAGGTDEPGNLLSLCIAHHAEAHTLGVMSFADKYSQFFGKIIAALSERDAINIFVTKRQE